MFEGLYNSIMQLIFIVTALVSVKELTSLITNLVGQGDALKDGADTGKEVMKRVGQTAAIGAMGAGAALKVGQAGLGVARNVGSTIANSKTVQGAKEKVGSGVQNLRNKTSEWYTKTNFGHSRQEKKAAEGFAAMFGDPDAEVNRSRWQNFKDKHEGVANVSNKLSNVGNRVSGGVSNIGSKVSSGVTKAGDWVSGGVSNIRQNLKKDETLFGDGKDNPGLIKNATEGLTGLAGAASQASGIHGSFKSLVDDGAVPFEKQVTALYSKYFGEDLGSAKKASEKAKAEKQTQAQANATAAATAAALSPELQKVNYGSSAQKDKDGNVTFEDMPSLIKQVLDAIKNLNVNTTTIQYEGEPATQDDWARAGGYAPDTQVENTGAASEQKAEVHGKVDANVSSEQLVNALNEVKNAINNTDKSISNRLGAMLVGIAAVQRSVQDNTRETKSSMEKVEKATQDVVDRIKKQGSDQGEGFA